MICIPLNVDDATQEIFSLILSKHIYSWFRLISDDSDFPDEIKLNLQHVCAVFLLRLQKINISEFITEAVFPVILKHFEDIISLNEVIRPTHTGQSHSVDDEEVLLQKIFAKSGLHPALHSRHSEYHYLRNIVKQLLPYLLIPPSLSMESVDRQVTSSKSALNLRANGGTDSFNVDTLSDSSSNYRRVGNCSSVSSEACARSLLTEILTTCLLLPLMDAVANPDLLNLAILYFLDPDKTQLDFLMEAPLVPVLRSFIDDWTSTFKKPDSETVEALLQQPQKLYHFAQYMKSHNAKGTLDTLLWMYEVMNKLSSKEISKALCIELRCPLEQLLRTVSPLETASELTQEITKGGINFTQCCTCLGRVTNETKAFMPSNLPNEFAGAIRSALNDPDALGVARLVHTQEWTNSFQVICDLFESFYIPAFANSIQHINWTFANQDKLCSYKFSNCAVQFSKPLDDPSDELGTTEHLNELLFIRPSRSILPTSTHELHSDNLKNYKKRHHKRNRLSDPPKERTLTAIDRDVDLAGWTVSVPTVSRPSLNRNQLPLLPLSERSLADVDSVHFKSPPLDISFLAFTTSRQGIFTVTAYPPSSDSSTSPYRVNRKYSEFYVLEQKLFEFHGLSITVQLPIKNLLRARDADFLEYIRPKFEMFLQYLIGRPFLRSSELIYAFLTSPAEFSDSLLPVINFGRLMKSVPLKLMKEKGQYIDRFIEFLRKSSLPERANPTNWHTNISASKMWYIYDEGQFQNPLLTSSIYCNNSNITDASPTTAISGFDFVKVFSFYDIFGYIFDQWTLPTPSDAEKASLPDSSPRSKGPPYTNFSLSEVFSDLRYFASHLYALWQRETCKLCGSREDVKHHGNTTNCIFISISTFFRRLLINLLLYIRPLFADNINNYLGERLDSVLRRYLKNDYLATIILLLKEELFNPNPPRTPHQKVERRQMVSQRLMSLISKNPLVMLCGSDLIRGKIELYLEIIQRPKWNKQLVYLLLDQVLLLLFPDILRNTVFS